jgi:hypothetical protein
MLAVEDKVDLLDYLEKCGGEDVIRVCWLDDVGMQFDGARQIGNKLRDQYAELPAKDRPDVRVEGNRVYIKAPK